MATTFDEVLEETGDFTPNYFTIDIEFLNTTKKTSMMPTKFVSLTKIMRPLDTYFPDWLLFLDMNQLEIEFMRDAVLNMQVRVTIIRNEPKPNERVVVMSEFFTCFFDENKIKRINIQGKKTYTGINQESGDLNTEIHTDIETTSLTQMVELKLYNTEALRISKNLIDFIIGNTTIFGAVDRIVAHLPGNIGVWFDQPDNLMHFPQVLMAPNTIFRALEFLQAQYGIYTSGMYTYFDNRIFYILKKFLNNRPSLSGGASNTTAFYIDERTEIRTNAQSYRTLDNRSDFYEVFRTTIIDEQIMLGEQIGNNFISSDFNIVLNAIQEDKGSLVEMFKVVNQFPRLNLSNRETGTKNVYDYDELNNAIATTSYLAETTPRARIVFGGLTNINPTSFNMGRNFIITMSDPDRQMKYGGVKMMKHAIIQYKINSTSPEDIKKVTCSLVDAEFI